MSRDSANDGIINCTTYDTSTPNNKVNDGKNNEKKKIINNQYKMVIITEIIIQMMDQMKMMMEKVMIQII